MKSILLNANEDSGCQGRLEAAVKIAAAFGSHITCLQVTPYDAYVLGDPLGGVYALPTVIEEVREAEQKQRSRVEGRLEREGAAFNWLHFDGQPAQVFIDRSRLADLIILSSQVKSSDGTLSLTGDVCLHARAPVLAMPQNGDGFDPLGTVLVAWNGSMESSHALRLSLPMLEKAAAVHIVTVCDDDTDFPATDGCEYLARHGVRSELHQWPREGRRVADAILDAAAVLKASYVVAGAYGHSRFREAVLGGVTRGLLDSSPVPLLLAH